MSAATGSYCRRNLLAAAAAALCALPAVTRADVVPAGGGNGVTYTYNDYLNLEYPAGMTLTDGATSTPSDMWLGNVFDATPAGQWVTRLDANFDSTMPAGTPISMLLYQVPAGGDMNHLTLLRRVDTTVQNTPAGYYSVPSAYAIPATHVTGKFVVAVAALNQPATATFRVDATAPHNNSYYAANTPPHVGTLDPAHPELADQPTQYLGPYDLFLSAKARATQFPKGQAPVVIDSFDDGDFTRTTDGSATTYGGIQSAGASALGGSRAVTYINQSAPMSVSVSGGALNISNGQITIGWGWTTDGSPGMSAGPGSALNANLDGYDVLRLHVPQASSFLHVLGSFGADTPNSSVSAYLPDGRYAPDASGNIDIPLSSFGSFDYADTDHFNLTIYSYSGTTTIDSISLLTTPLAGDVNLDGGITGDDYAAIDRGFQLHLAGRANGDLNNDGAVDAADYLLLDTALGQQQGGTLSPDLLAERRTEFGDAYVTELLAAVPEPASVSLLAALPLAIATRGRRRR